MALPSGVSAPHIRDVTVSVSVFFSFWEFFSKAIPLNRFVCKIR